MLAALDERADEVISKYMWAAGGAAAINPIPLLDLAGGSAITVKMVLDLAAVYQQQIDADTVVTLLGPTRQEPDRDGRHRGRRARPSSPAIASLMKTVPASARSPAASCKAGPGAGHALDRPRVLRILQQRNAAAAGRPRRTGPPRMGRS